MGFFMAEQVMVVRQQPVHFDGIFVNNFIFIGFWGLNSTNSSYSTRLTLATSHTE
jgi:hypothetical protein